MSYCITRKRKPRYNAHSRQDCRGGCKPDGLPRLHHSIEEAHYCDQIAMLVKSGEYRSYKSQVKYDLKDLHGASVGWMMVDFEVIKANGDLVVIEYKGKFFGQLMEYRQKKALFSWNYPKTEYVTVGRKQIVI